MKIVITGATSFVGHELTRQLLHAGHEIFAVVRPSSQLMHVLQDCPDIHRIELDLGDLSRLPELIPSCDIFFHLGWDGGGAANRARPDIQQENVQHTRRAVLAARDLDCWQFFLTGSQAEYGPQREIISETSTCRPVTEYGKAKLASGQLASSLSREFGLSFIHGRIFSIYGPEDHPWTLVSNCIRMFWRGEALALSSCEQNWNYLYIEDAVRSIIALSTANPADEAPVYNIAGTDTRPLREFVEEIRQLTGGQGLPQYGSRQNEIEKPYSLMPSVSKLMQATGWQPGVQFADGIRRIIAFYQQQGILVKQEA